MNEIANKTLRVIFAGTPDFSVPTLQKLYEQEEVIGVLTQPDRPAGRGKKLTASPIKQFALTHDIPILQPKTLKNEFLVQTLKEMKPDVMIVVAYGLIIPQKILDIPTFGCMNVHASLLPRWRGAAPIQRAIEAGDKETGVTIMQMDAGLDTGDMLQKTLITITQDHDAQLLHDQLAQLGAETLASVLESLKQNQLKPERQIGAQATYAQKLNKVESRIDWSISAEQIDRKIRAFYPWPGSFFQFDGQNCKVHKAFCLDDTLACYKPGTVINFSREGLDIGTKQGVLRVLVLQLPGKKATQISDFYNANQQRFKVGVQLN